MLVDTKSGAVRGAREGALWAFRGIPFAEAPIGDLRFQPPVPKEPWQGALDCTRDGMRPLQTPAPWATDAATHAYGEDCLNLNVWTPAADGRRRPVVFFLFGGGHFEGSNCEVGMDGGAFLQGEDMVMVAPNYRVGALGYLYLGHLLGDAYRASGSLGLLDQVLALRWVRDNIERFGGDPGRVVLLGQSAGGKSVMNLLLAPSARGLFHGAIAMSGAWQSIKDLATERALTANFLGAAGIDEGDARRVLTLSSGAILRAQERANGTYFKAESYGPTADGIALPEDVEAAASGGGIAKVPVLMGHTLQELHLRPDADMTDIGMQGMQERCRWKFGDNAPAVMDAYRAARLHEGFAPAYGACMTRYTYVEGFLRTARMLCRAGTPLHLYRWAYQAGGIANHTSDLEALFGRTAAEKRRSDPAGAAAMERMLHRVWTQFIREGTPAAEGLPDWPICAGDEAAQMDLDKAPETRAIRLDAYDARFPLQVMRLTPEAG